MGTQSLPGTTSRASMASLYSMKPNPFMSLISVISPVPCVAKCASTSALVAVEDRQYRQCCRSEPRLGQRALVALHFAKGLPFRGKLPRYRRVDDTSVIVYACATTKW